MIAGHSLWIKPDPGIFNELKNLIAKLARVHSGPSFDPHITLLGRMFLPEEEIIEKTTLLAEHGPFGMELTDIGTSSEYFRALFIKVRSPVLERLRHRAIELFEIENPPPYMPHLSLMYTDLDQREKNKIVKEIDWRGPLTFEASSILVVSVPPEVNNWRSRACIKLSSR